MPTSDAREEETRADVRESWADIFDRLAAADREETLPPDDLERLATAAYLTGRDEESADARARAHQALLDRGEKRRAARSAFWLAFQLLMRGERARGGGWLSRARRLLDDLPDEGVEEGFLLVPAGLGSLAGGKHEAALDAFTRAAEAGERFADDDLAALGRLGRGQALVRLGETEEGVALLDEAMAAAEAGLLSPIVLGVVYCAVIEICHEIFDLERATEWTAALSRWCESRPELVPYRGQCLVRRAEILELRGDWPDALKEARRAGDVLTRPPGEPAAGAAFYRQAELHRLRGEDARAEKAYREASRWGRETQPGLALLRLARGEVDAAEAALQRALDEADDRGARCRILPALVEVLLTAGDVTGARAAADELSGHAAALDAPLLRALADRARGGVRLAEGEPRAGLDALRAAWDEWKALEAPYEAARTRLLVGRACRELGDEEGAELEIKAAARTFRELGAEPDVARAERLLESDRPGSAHGLTSREMEVLEHVATGETNREIGARLSISERTVERHLTNIYRKLRVSSRAAATAYAYEHDIL